MLLTSLLHSLSHLAQADSKLWGRLSLQHRKATARPPSSTKRSRHKKLFDSLPALNSEIAFTLLRACAEPAWNYVTRTHENTETQSKRFDEMVTKTFKKLSNIDQQHTLTAAQAALLHLPVREGGFGLRSYGWMSSENYLASSTAGDDQQTRTERVDAAAAAFVDGSSFQDLRRKNKQRHASDWILGADDNFTFGNSAFATAVQLRLGYSPRSIVTI